MVKVGDIMIVTGTTGHFIPVGSKVTVVKVDNDDPYGTYEVEDESGLHQWVCNDDLQQFSPPEKITQNGYEYSLIGPVKPEWLVDGAWVVNTDNGEKRLVKEERSGVFNLKVNDLVSIRYHDGIRNQYRPHEPKDWKWGDWAMYDGKRVFVVCPELDLNHAMISGESFLDGLKYVSLDDLTPTF